VQVTLLPSGLSLSGPSHRQYLTSYLIDETLAVDAGSLGFFGTPEEQARVKHILLSHSHQDHIASLPIFLDNTFARDRECVTVHASEAVLDCIRKDMFNNRVWFNCLAGSPSEPPFLRLATLEAEKPVMLAGLRITPVEVHHTVPTFGFILEDDHSAIAISSDTGPTSRLWKITRETPNLKAVFLEATFPNRLAWLADVSLHLTPEMFAEELAKLARNVPVVAVHLKARYHEEIVEEMQKLALKGVQIFRPGQTFVF
jgi:ribonuclease BN (tRNA processing enzyme)